MSIRYYIILIIAVGITACSPQSKKADKLSEYSISIENPMGLKEMPLSNFVDSISTVILETTNESLMSHASNIVIYKNKIYISDVKTESIKVFTDKGEFIKSFHKQGSGPQDYVKLTDFSVDNDCIYILDMLSRAVLIYNLDLDFLERVKLTGPGLNLIATNDNIWVYNIFGHSTKDDFELFHIDKDRNKSEFFKRKYAKNQQNVDIYTWSEGNVFNTFNGNVYYSERFGSNIYNLQDDDFSLYLTVDFGEYTIPKDINPDYYESIFYSDKFPYVLKEFFFVSGKYNIIQFRNAKGTPCYAFQDKKSNKTDIGLIKNDFIPDFYRFIPIFATDNILIEPMNSALIWDEDFQGILEFNPSLKNVSDDDNFILIMYHLKR